MRRAIVGLALAGLLLSGCASSTPEFPSSTAADLQERVLAVTTASADGNAITALLRLQELEAAAYAAAARSTISEARLASILTSIALVRSDLEKALSDAELAELQKRLDDLDRQTAAPAEAGNSGGGPGGREADGKVKEKAAKQAEKERRKAAEEQRKTAEQTEKAPKKND